MRSSGHGIMLVILTCALATANIIECRERFSLHFDFGDAGEDDLVIDEKMVEHTLDQCMNQMINREGDTRSKSRLLCRKKIHQAIDELSPQTEQTLLDCIKKNLNFQLSSEEASFKQLYIEYAQLLVSFQNAPRRFLATELPEERSRKRIPLSPTSGPSALPPTPFSSMPAPAVAPARNMNQVAPASKRSPMPWFRSPPSAPNKITSPSPQPTAKKNAAPAVDSKKKPEKPKHKDIRRQELIIAVVTTAVSTFSLAALLFLCCLRRQGRRIGPRNGPNDGRPLLNSTLSAASGSSQQSISVGSSAKIEVTSESGDNPSLVKNASVKPHSSSSMTEAQSSKDPPTPAPPPPLPTPPGPPPPPPPRRPPAPPKVPAPPPKPVTGLKKPSPLGPHRQARSISSKGNEVEGESGAAKTKLKPFFWDKVLASPDHAMVWHEISSGSFQFNEEMIESLFGCKAATKNPNDRDKSLAASESSSQYIQIIDTRKAQNLSIILKALNLTSEEVVGALQEGSELPVELLQTLLKMAPTTDEELKLRLFAGDVSQLGPAERFLKTLVDIPYAFKRIEALIFMSSHQEDISGIKESFKTLEVACDKLRSSRLFLKLLEAVLKTGNRMNDGTYRGGAQAFRLDTLLKLADVKGTDGKTTLLHFVVQEIIRSEGVRAARTAKASQSMSSLKAEELPENSNPQSVENYCIRGLQVVSGLSTELEDVKKAAVIDADSVTATVSKLSTSLTKTKAFLNTEMKNVEEKTKIYDTVTKFVEDAEKDVEWLLEEEKRIMALVKSTADYFHGNAGRDEGLRLFSIVRDFLVMLDKSCKDVKITTTNPRGTSRKETLSSPPSQESRQPFSDMRKLLFPEIEDRRMDFSSSSSSSSSDDES